MNLHFTTPDLRQLDGAGGEVLACAIFSDEHPAKGVVALVDWRMAGRLSRRLESGLITGELGEVVLIPGKPRVPFEKLLILGAGPRADFDERAYATVIQRLLVTLGGLRIRMAVVERPGRHLGVIDSARGIDLLLEASADSGGQDSWTLVETAEEQKLITQRLADERHRTRVR